MTGTEAGTGGAYQAAATYIGPINADRAAGHGVRANSNLIATNRKSLIARVKSLDENAVKSLWLSEAVHHTGNTYPPLSYSTSHARHSLMDKPPAVGGFCE